jgi:hypothetical protein
VAADSTTRAKLKHPTGWFAAGREVISAMALLSDGAFKLYMLLCLRADRSTGRLGVDQASLAKSLAKSRRSIVVYFEELGERGVCEARFAANQHTRGYVRICDAFWPYHVINSTGETDSAANYVNRIRTLFASRTCVVNSFAPADEKLARSLFRDNVSLEHVERAFLLGCTRKHVSWLNGQLSGPISSLLYFRAIIDEVAQSQVSPDYWRYLAQRLEHFERDWLAKKAVQTQPTCEV